MNPAQNLGYEQYWKNWQIDDCPFDDSSDEATHWIIGWNEAEMDYQHMHRFDDGN